MKLGKPDEDIQKDKGDPRREATKIEPTQEPHHDRANRAKESDEEGHTLQNNRKIHSADYGHTSLPRK
jgi:hypothetical protein